MEGRGPATISEVAFQCKQLTPDEKEENEGQFKEMREQLKEAEQRLEALTCKETRALTQRSLLDQLSSRVGSSTTKVSILTFNAQMSKLKKKIYSST